MKSITYYVTRKDGKSNFSTENVVGNDNCICKMGSKDFKIYRGLTETFERVTKIILNSNSSTPNIIEGPELLKFLKNSDSKDLLESATDIKFFTEISGQFFVKNGYELIFIDPKKSYFNDTVKEKLVIEPTDKTLKVKLLSQNLRIQKENVEKNNYIQMVSFDIKNKMLRIFDQQRIGDKLRVTTFKYLDQYSVLTNLPQEVLNDIANQLVEMHSKEDGKEYKLLDNPTVKQIVSFNANPSFPGYLVCKNFLGHKFNSTSLERNEFLKDAADFLGLDYNERFDKLFEFNPHVFAFASAAKDAGITNIDKVIDLFLNMPNQNSYKMDHLFDSSIVLSSFKNGLKAALKYRTEEEVLDGLSSMQYFYTDTFKGMQILDDYNFFDGAIFDRFVYNRFNDHAFALVNIIIREKMQQICREITNEKTKNSESSLESYDVTDEEEIKKLAKMIKTDSSSFNKKRMKAIKICYSEGNPCFVIKTDDNRWHSHFPSCSINVLNRGDVSKLYNYEDNLNKEEAKLAASAKSVAPGASSISEDEDELPFF